MPGSLSVQKGGSVISAMPRIKVGGGVYLAIVVEKEAEVASGTRAGALGPLGAVSGQGPLKRAS